MRFRSRARRFVENQSPRTLTVPRYTVAAHDLVDSFVQALLDRGRDRLSVGRKSCRLFRPRETSPVSTAEAGAAGGPSAWIGVFCARHDLGGWLHRSEEH